MFDILSKYYNKEFAERFKDLYNRRNLLNLYTLISSIVDLLYEDNGSDAYLVTLLDMAMMYADKGGASFFLEQWEENISSVDIAISDDSEGVNVMTIHSAKGLGFPVVILPYVNWNKGMSRYSTLPVMFEGNKYFIRPNKNAKKLFIDIEEEEKKSQQDNGNLLYVAFTRTKEELYIRAPVSGKEKSVTKMSRIVKDIFEEMKDEFTQLTDNVYYLGKKENKDSGIKNEVVYVSFNRYNWQDRVTVNSKKYSVETDDIKLGNAFHKIMQLSFPKECSEELINRILKEFDATDYKDKISKWITYTLNTDIMRSLQSGDYRIYKERSFLYQGGVYRMDLIGVKKEKVVLIDYKTGEKKEEDSTQILFYKEILEKMAYTVSAHLIYVDKEEVQDVY